MIRIYLDTNILIYFKSEKFVDLFNLINENRNLLIIPFSSAHIRDKIPSKSNYEEKYLEDLSFLDNVFDNLLLQFDPEKKITIPKIASIKKDYAHFIEKGDLDSKDLMNKDIFDSIFEIFSETFPENIISSFKKLTDIEYEDINGELTSTRKSITAAQNQLNHIWQNPTGYTEARKKIQSKFELPPINREWDNKIIVKIKSELTAKNISMEEFGLFQDDNLDELSLVMNTFSSLDIAGYYCDKKSKSNFFSNMVQDATHTYNAANCDLFISSDKNLLKKAKAIYEYLNIGTLVLNPSDALPWLTKELANSMNFEDLVYDIKKTSPYHHIKDKKLSTEFYSLKRKFIGYFNRCKLDVDRSFFLISLTKEYTNISRFMFHKEIRQIVNLTSKEFNIKFMDDDIESFISGKLSKIIVNHNYTVIELCLINAEITLNFGTYHKSPIIRKFWNNLVRLVKTKSPIK